MSETRRIDLTVEETEALVAASRSNKVLHLAWLADGVALEVLPETQWAVKALAEMRGVILP